MTDAMEVVSIDGYVNVPSNDGAAVKAALYEHGPLGIVVDATHYGSYWGGVFDKCGYSKNIDLNHGVVLVGYDTKNGVDYWIVRNSWGASFGEGGYLNIIRETD